MPDWKSDYDVAAKVYPDGDKTLKMTITAVMFVGEDMLPTYRLSYFSNGDLKEIWLEEWRLDLVQQ